MRILIINAFCLFLVVAALERGWAAETPSQIIYATIQSMQVSDWPQSTIGWKRDKSMEPAIFKGKPKPVEQEAGLVVFNRNWSFYTYVRSVPRGSERKKPFRIKVTPGEFEPMSVSLFCLDNLKNIKASIGKAGSIPPSAWKIYNVVSVPMPWKRDWTFKSAREEKIYDIVPIHLLDLPGGVKGNKRKCLQFIFDLQCPENARSGLHEGYFEISTDRATLKIPFTVEVLPFKLTNIDEKWQRGWFEGGKATDEELGLFKQFGFNSIAYWWFNCYPLFGPAATKSGKMELFAADREKIMGPKLEMLKRNDYNSWVWFMMDQGFGKAVSNWWDVPKYPNPQYKEKYIQTVKELVNLLKENNYPSPFFVVNDEPTNRRRGYDTKRIFNEMEWISNIEGVRNYTVLFGNDDVKEFRGKPYLHMWVSNNPSPEKYKAALKNKCTLATYRGGHVQRKIADVRFHFGWKSFYFDSPLTFTWGNHWGYLKDMNLRQMLNDFLGKAEGAYHTLSFPTTAGPSVTYVMLAHREAVDDRAYAETLEALIGNAPLMKLKKEILQKFIPKGRYSNKGIPEWADPWTYGQTIQHQNNNQPNFMNDWRDDLIQQMTSP